MNKYEVVFSPEHWNRNAQATIPAAWDIIKDGFIIASAETELEAWDTVRELVLAEVK